ncbi:DEBR0S1_23398g1_1 [Brettanomyces bruxellensis]|nr:DEBR0S1_23398g1_1 [Brettanomyces bruxellensis]
MRLSEEYGKLSSQNELLAEEYSTYKDNSLVMEKQLRRDIEFKSDEIKKLREELSSSISKSEADRLRDSIKIAEKEAKNFAEERNKLEKDNDDLRVKIEDLRISKNSFQRRLELLHSKNLETDSEMNELERLRDQISEVSTENRSLKSSLKKSTDELEEHKERLERLIQEKKLLAKSMNELESNQKSAMIKNEKLQDDLKMARNLQKSSKSVLQEKIQDKNEEIKKLINDYNNMKNELLDRFSKERANKKQIEQNLEEATDKLQMLKVREGMLLQEEEKLQEQLNKSKRIKSARVEKDYPPTPRTPTHDSNQNNIDIPLMEARVNLLESQRDLYRLKLQDLKNLAADLKFANEYLERELRSKNVTIDKNVSLLKATLEQRPDELGRNATKLPLFSRKSRTFAGGALAVLAIIRLKHRLEARKRRKIQERFIKDRILQQQRDL